jgi:hypothetical protein
MGQHTLYDDSGLYLLSLTLKIISDSGALRTFHNMLYLYAKMRTASMKLVCSVAITHLLPR